MTDASGRIVFFLYSSREETPRPHPTVRPARKRNESLRLTQGAKSATASKLSRYAPLMLDGEHAVIVAAPNAEIPGIVKDLRRVGEPTIFMLTERVGDAEPARTGVSPVSMADM